jgi:hypothetical protein
VLGESEEFLTSQRSPAASIDLMARAAIPPGTNVNQLKRILEATFGFTRHIQYVGAICVAASSFSPVDIE